LKKMGRWDWGKGKLKNKKTPRCAREVTEETQQWVIRRGEKYNNEEKDEDGSRQMKNL